ncbi:MAG: response regulator transcription factor [Planctomycetota bacterium]|jgi:RNA polymerase sigma factor (sigma-70 family)
MRAEATVFVVDDDADLRESVKWLLQKAGLKVRTHASAEHFLDDYDPETPGCVLIDLRMPGMSGLELQQRMIEREWDSPVIILTGHGDVPMAVRALEAGAAAFIEKPFSREFLLDRIRQALEKDAEDRRRRTRRAEVESRLALLTPRERQVMQLAVAGTTTSQIARGFGVSERTIEVHRSRIMKKMQVDSLADLVVVAMQCGMREPTPNSAS